jgi:hypothetical protein
MSEPWALHSYQYVEQNPVFFWDPDGEQPRHMGGSKGQAAAGYFGDAWAGLTSLFVGGSPDLKRNTWNPARSANGAVIVGGVTGGLLRGFSLRAYPKEANPNGFGKLGTQLGANLVPILDPATRLVTGTDAVGDPTSRLMAGAELFGQVIGAYAHLKRAGRSGSGPAPGVIEISNRVKSTATLRTYTPRPNPAYGGNKVTEFVYDPVTRRFAVGKASGSGSPHQNLARAVNPGYDPDKVVGGIFGRQADGSISTQELSGHFGKNWTNRIRSEFVEFIEGATGQKVVHDPY